jgi:uncharacterized membrane protein
MGKGRLEAFSDGVIAIIITIMALELRAPENADWAALRPLGETFLSYVLSFVFIGIYWNNHHHLLQAVKRVNGRVLWANTLLLFCLSLVPFVTAWLGRTGFAAAPAALYGIVLLCSAFAYFLLVRALLSLHGGDSVLAAAIGSDLKGKISLALYAAGVMLSRISPRVSFVIYALVALIWLVPDKRIEKVMGA